MNVKEAVLSRRSVNFFNPEKEISDDLLKEIVELSSQTPSGFNLQPWNIIVLRDLEEKMRLRKHAMGQPKVSEAPVTLIILADTEGWEEGHETVERSFQEMIKAGSAKEKQRDFFNKARSGLYGKDRDSSLSFAVKSSSFFAMTLMLVAKSMGIDSHPMDGFKSEAVKEEFNIPDKYFIPLLISLGYFKEGKEVPPPKWRKSFEDIVVKF